MTEQMRIYVIERAIVDKIEYLPGQVLDLPVHAARRLLADSGAFTTEAPALPTPITISHWPEGWTQADVERLQALLAEQKLPPSMLFPFNADMEDAPPDMVIPFLTPNQGGTPVPALEPVIDPVPVVTLTQATVMSTGDQGGDQPEGEDKKEGEPTEEDDKPTDEGKSVDQPPADKAVKSPPRKK